MNILTADTITKSYQERVLFREASFYLQENEKVGIIGINGTGKSTLLRMLAGLEEPDEGEIIKANHVVIRYLPQMPVPDPEATVLEAVMGKQQRETEDWGRESAAKSMLQEVDINDYGLRCGQLSGGQKKKLALVSVLLEQADILILDEPTNHLDYGTAEWLEKKLKEYRGAVVMVTHDRYFLDSVTGRIVEISHGKIYSYETNYEGYLERKSTRESIEDAEERKRKTLLRTELEWLKRGARARSTKQKARLQRVEQLSESRIPERDRKVELDSVSSRLGKMTVELDGIGKSFGDKNLFRDFSYIFLKQDRIGFIGPNGCGKTTMMKVISGECLPDTGQVLTGPTVKIGYFAQEVPFFDETLRVIDYVREGAEFVHTSEGSVSAAKMLERFLFTPDMQYNAIGKLSGGEKRRLYLLRILMEEPNFLLLDEPTNDLDITTLTILEDYLDRFQGIVAVVSHDRYFLDRTVKRIFSFEDGTIRQYEGGYSDYVYKRGKIAAAEDREEKKEKKSDPENGKRKENERREQRTRKLKFSFQEQKDYDNIEGEIRKLEEKADALDQQMARYTTDFVKLNELNRDLDKTRKLLDEKMERWVYLEELAERIRNQ